MSDEKPEPAAENPAAAEPSAADPGHSADTGPAFVEPTIEPVEEPAAPEALVEPPQTSPHYSGEIDYEQAQVSESEPVLATADPAAVETVVPPVQYAPAPQQVVYVQAPQPPKKKSNRGVGILLVVAATVVFALLLALVTALFGMGARGGLTFDFLAAPTFYIPVLFFGIAFVLLVILSNRAGWWAYILGSIAVAVIVYFGTIGLGLLSTGIVQNTPTEAAIRFSEQLVNPFIIVATLLAREVSLWTGALISRRGRKVKARNADALAAFEAEAAERQAEAARQVGAY